MSEEQVVVETEEQEAAPSKTYTVDRRVYWRKRALAAEARLREAEEILASFDALMADEVEYNDAPHVAIETEHWEYARQGLDLFFMTDEDVPNAD